MKRTSFIISRENCYICKIELSTDKQDKNLFKLCHKVRDHCHYTRKYRGSADNNFNLRYK